MHTMEDLAVFIQFVAEAVQGKNGEQEFARACWFIDSQRVNDFTARGEEADSGEYKLFERLAGCR